jgi:dihydrofolate reductase
MIMRRIVVGEFLSLDGVMQAPGNPDEGREDGFTHGGWTMPYWHDEIGVEIFKSMQASDALLLGRKTYQGFEAAFASLPAGDPFVDHMNNTPKYVVSTTLAKAEWQNSTLIKSNVIEEVRKLKEQPGKDISISGSGQLIHTLMQHDLVDEYGLLVYPIVLGSGNRLFPNGVDTKLKLVESKTFPTGVISLRYERDTQ